MQCCKATMAHSLGERGLKGIRLKGPEMLERDNLFVEQLQNDNWKALSAIDLQWLLIWQMAFLYDPAIIWSLIKGGMMTPSIHGNTEIQDNRKTYEEKCLNVCFSWMIKLYSILFYSFWFYSILFFSVLFYSIITSHKLIFWSVKTWVEDVPFELHIPSSPARSSHFHYLSST